jgi:DNA mismatch repair ATPase MutS
MDINTIRNLELVRNIRSGDWKHSLMGFMNHCKTSMGSRLLRASILQPMQSGTNIEKLNARFDVSGDDYFAMSSIDDRALGSFFFPPIVNT